MSLPALVLRYALFAPVATVVNLMLQRLVLAISPTTIGYVLGLIIGTVVGLGVKFILDKLYIFGDRASGFASNGRSFLKYASTGIATTLIFFTIETAFWLYWGTQTMREAGALLGLAIGYVAKYRLDRHFVFPAKCDMVPRT